MSFDARGHYLAEFEQTAAALPGMCVPWLRRLRLGALDVFAQRGFPTRHDEDWKYTSLAPLREHAFRVPDGGLADAAAAMAGRLALEEDGHLMVFHNGRHAPSLSSLGQLPSGVRACSLASMLNTDAEWLEPYLSGSTQQAGLAALNTAFMADGAVLHLGRGVALEKPLHLLFIASGQDTASHIRNLVIAEEGASATVIEHYAGAGDTRYFSNAVTQISAAANASVTHHKLQQEAPEAIHIAGIHATQLRDSLFASTSCSFGAALARNDITTAFDAPGCEATLDGLYLVDGRRHVDHHTRIDHRTPHGTSREHYRGVLDGQSHAVFNGKVVVHPNAQKTNAFQANHNLLLSRDAEIDTKPELEIYADDVKCNHGATVGRLDDAQLFYLRSRGLDEATARDWLVHAFAREVIGRIGVAALRMRLEQLLLARLPQQERIGELR